MDIRQELLELVSQTGSRAINDVDSQIASFLRGELSLSEQEIDTLKTQFRENWIDKKEMFKKQLREYESYSPKEYFNLPDDQYDDDIYEALRDKVSNRKDLTKTLDITRDKQLHFDKQWQADEIFKFSNGTSETRARLFLSQGKGYTALQSAAFVEGEAYLSRTGLQISMQGTDFETRSPEYARIQSSRFKDRPVIIEGEVPAQYVYANQTRGGEFSIPHQYYDKITSARILDAETKTELYHLENGKLVQSTSFIEAQLPELQIKSSNRSTFGRYDDAIIRHGHEQYQNIIDEYREIIFDKYKQYADFAQLNAATYGGDNLLSEDFINIIGNNGGIYGETIRHELISPNRKREEEILKYLEEQGLTQHIETIANESGRSYTVTVDDTEKFINETIINEDFRKRLNEHVSSEEFNNIYINNRPNVDNIPKATQETIEQTGKEMADAISNKATKTLPKKSLSGGSKWAIGLAIAGLAIGGIIASSDKKETPKKEKKQQTNNIQSQQTIQQPTDSAYAMQMAQDISSYKYGKHMTGFVNF